MDGPYTIIGSLFLGAFFLIGAMCSLEVGRTALYDKAENTFGEDFISTNCDGSGTTFDCDIYNKEGEFIGRYHKVAAWGYIFDKESAYRDAQIIKLEGK